MAIIGNIPYFQTNPNGEKWQGTWKKGKVGWQFPSRVGSGGNIRGFEKNINMLVNQKQWINAWIYHFPKLHFFSDEILREIMFLEGYFSTGFSRRFPKNHGFYHFGIKLRCNEGWFLSMRLLSPMGNCSFTHHAIFWFPLQHPNFWRWNKLVNCWVPWEI